ncbi:unnamed protein product [Prunus brigantina]
MEECSIVIQSQLPPKQKDPGRFSIPCTIGTISFQIALCDLEVEFKVFDATKYPIDSEYCFRLEAVDHVVRPQFMADYPKDPLKASLVHEIEVGEEPHEHKMVNSLETKAIPSTIAAPTLTLQRYLEENCNQQKETFALHDPG